MIYKIKHGDREIAVIASTVQAAERFVKNHYGEPPAVIVEVTEPIDIQLDLDLRTPEE